MARWEFHISAFELYIWHTAGTLKHAAEKLSGLETVGRNTTDLDDDFPEMMVSVFKQGGRKINNDHD